jgi:hypothetical protein
MVHEVPHADEGAVVTNEALVRDGNVDSEGGEVDEDIIALHTVIALNAMEGRAICGHIPQATSIAEELRKTPRNALIIE